MRRMLVEQKAITNVTLDDVPDLPLADGQARIRLDHFALTANNVTYAASGFEIGYWQFFPTGVDGQGLVPVWGTGKVEESRSDDLAVGTRLYGFYPMAESLVITPRVDGQGMVEDVAAHRAELPAVYNRYAPTKGSDEAAHMRALLQPLLATSYLIFDWLMDNDCFGADQIIIGSASSKTGLGLAKFLAEPTDRAYRIVGLTSAANMNFVRGLGACDQVLCYEDVTDLDRRAAVYVDMAGNAAVKAALHGHLADHLKHSAAVGISHWDQFQPKLELAGVKPQFFFAPAQIAKRRADWGAGEIETRITHGWKRIAADASDWLDVRHHDGLEAAVQIYGQLAEGRANPQDGHIVVMGS